MRLPFHTLKNYLFCMFQKNTSCKTICLCNHIRSHNERIKNLQSNFSWQPPSLMLYYNQQLNIDFLSYLCVDFFDSRYQRDNIWQDPVSFARRYRDTNKTAQVWSSWCIRIDSGRVRLAYEMPFREASTNDRYINYSGIWAFCGHTTPIIKRWLTLNDR